MILLKPVFLFHRPGDFESVKQIAKVIKNATVCGLSRAVEKDIEAAAEALKYAEAHAFIQALALPILISKQNSILQEKRFWKEPFNV